MDRLFEVSNQWTILSSNLRIPLRDIHRWASLERFQRPHNFYVQLLATVPNSNARNRYTRFRIVSFKRVGKSRRMCSRDRILNTENAFGPPHQGQAILKILSFARKLDALETASRFQPKLEVDSWRT